MKTTINYRAYRKGSTIELVDSEGLLLYSRRNSKARFLYLYRADTRGRNLPEVLLFRAGNTRKASPPILGGYELIGAFEILPPPSEEANPPALAFQPIEGREGAFLATGRSGAEYLLLIGGDRSTSIEITRRGFSPFLPKTFPPGGAVSAAKAFANLYEKSL